MGDVNGDGLADLIVGAPLNNIGANADVGRSYVVFGQTGTTAIDLSAIAATAGGTGGFVVNGQTANDWSGWSVSDAGDVNGDGLADLIVGAQQADPTAGTSAGRSYVVFGKTGTAAIDLSAVVGGTGGFVINGQAASDESGISVSGAGDVNGDGLADLIVGAHLADPAAGADAGRSYVVFGKTGTTAIDLTTVANGTGGFAINGQAIGDKNGAWVSSAGDVDGDGLSDLIVGAYLANVVAVVDAGRSYVILSTKMVQSYFDPELIELGTTGNDTLTGTSNADRIVAGAGNDTIEGAGGADVLYGGAGNDTFILTADNIDSLADTGAAPMRIDGGFGHDVVQLAAGITSNLDLTALPNVVFRGIEAIEMTNGAANTLKLSVRDLLDIHDEGGQAGGVINRLLVRGDATDTVQLASGTGTWSASGTEDVNSVTYNVYVNTSSAWDKLLVQGATVSIL